MKFSSILIHFMAAALACTQLAYWSIRLMTPPPTPAPAPARAVTVRDADPVLLARAFGQVERVAAAVSSNIQVAGVFAAGRDSAAVFVVDDRPARAVLLGQDVAPGSKLVDVSPQGVTLESGGVRRQLRVPNAPLASMTGSGSAAAGFERRGNVLTAPSAEVSSAPRSTQARAPGGLTPPRSEPPPPGPAARGALLGTPTAQ